MGDYDLICFSAAVFISGLLILQRSADGFIAHTTRLAARLHVPPTLIALLTGGAKWEELIVVIASRSQHNSPLALGNILGSTIANVLGAFSLGLIFSPESVTFDRSAKIYTAVLLSVTTFLVPFLLFSSILGPVGGALLIVAFTVYITSVCWAIYKGIILPHEGDGRDDSDSDNDSDQGTDLSALDSESAPLRTKKPTHYAGHSGLRSPSSITIGLQDLNSDMEEGRNASSLETDLVPSLSLDDPPANIHALQKPRRSIKYHIFHLTISVILLSLSGYILSHSITTIAESSSISSTVVGATILSFATTLPEKLVAVMGGRRRQTGIIVANTVGSNIFLLTLCSGLLFLFGDLASLITGVTSFEVLCLWGSSAVLFGVVTFGGHRWMGWALLALYVMFTVFEFLLDRT